MSGKTVSRRSLVVLLLVASTVLAQTKTRLFILMDNSNSMSEQTNGSNGANPDGSYDLDPAWLVADPDGGTTADGGVLKTCDLAGLQDAGFCKSKFCSAKCVLYSAMDPYEDLFDFGFASYNSYYRRVKLNFSTGPASSQCNYDVLAAPNETGGTIGGQFWSATGTLAGSCAITRDSAHGGVRDLTTLGGTYGCDQVPGTSTSDPAKTCTTVVTNPVTWYNGAAVGNWDRYSLNRANMSGAAIASPVATVRDQCSMVPMPGLVYSCPPQFSDATIYPTAGGPKEPTTDTYGGTTHYLKKVIDFPPVSAPNGSWPAGIDTFVSNPAGGLCIGAGEAIGDTVNANGGPPTGGYNTALNRLTSASGNTTYLPAAFHCGPSPYLNCTWTLINKVSVTPVAQSWQNESSPSLTTGATYAGVTRTVTLIVANQTSCPALTNVATGSLSSAPNCSATTGNRCNAPAGTLQNGTLLTVTAYDPAATAPVGYTYSSGPTADLATVITGATEVSGAAACAGLPDIIDTTAANGCSSSVTAKCVYANSGYAPNPGDSSKGHCKWTRYATVYTKQNQDCKYTVTQYRFDKPQTPVTQCSWNLRAYQWRPQLYRYDWKAAGGEFVGTETKTLDPANNLCSAATFPSPIPGACPTSYNSSDPAAPALCKAVSGRQCRLRWWGTDGVSLTPYTKGRFSRYNSGVKGSDYTASKCAAIDYNNAPVSTLGPLRTQAFALNQMDLESPPVNNGSWCTGSGSSTPDKENLMVIGDPYDSPTSTLPNPKLSSSWYMPWWNAASHGTAGQYLGGTITEVKYSTDGSNWADEPVSRFKNVGWSRLPGGTPSIYFQDFSPTALPNIKDMIVKLPMHSSPLQYNYLYPTDATKREWVVGANTPLYGSISDFDRYLRNEILPVDHTAECRYYGFVLLTDGDENQNPYQANHPSFVLGPTQDCNPWDGTAPGCQTYPDFSTGTQLEGLVTTLKGANGGSPDTTPKEIKPFIVSYGNGATSDTLDRMARKAGTAINSAGAIDLVNGLAYKPQSGDELRAVFAAIVSNLGQSRYARSKPTIVKDSYGAMVYTASYNFSPLGKEWFGYVDAYDTSALGPGLQTPVWQLQNELQNQSASQREVFTQLPSGLVDVNGSLSGPQKAALITATGVADNTELSRLITFVLNPNPSPGAPFNPSGLIKRNSRLAATVHSTPAVVGPPRALNTWPGENTEEAAYAAYKAAFANRESRLFVASNDGIVHAVCEQTGSTPPTCNSKGGRGSEVYGFIPPAVHSVIKNTQNGQTFTTDGSFGAGDVCFSNCAPGSGYGGWFSLLLGSMHKGGNSIFALDVTNADQPGYQWTFNDSLGETWSPPTVMRATVDMPSGLGGTQKRWVGIVGGGYEAPDQWGNRPNKLSFIDLHTGTLLQDNTSGSCNNALGEPIGTCSDAHFRLDANPVSCDARAPGSNKGPCSYYRNTVPARVALVRSTGAIAKAGYVGDTQGNLWATRLDSPKVADWKPQMLFNPADNACKTDVFSNTAPIYDATDLGMVSPVSALQIPLNQVQPIYQRVNAEVQANGLTYVFAGTGDVNDTNNNSTYDYLYAIQDTKPTSGPLPACVGKPLWIKRLPRGQKILSEMATQANVLFVSAFAPAPSSDPCNSPGDTVLYAFYMENGKPAAVFDNAVGGRDTSVRIADTGIPADTTLVPSGTDSVTVLVRTQDPLHQFETRRASNLLLPGKIRTWRRVR